MAVYFKFKSAKDFDSIPIDGHFISVANLKDRIFESKFGKGTGFDLILANAQSNEEYLDEATLIPKNTSLLVRRVPVQRRLPIVTNYEEQKVQENNMEHEQTAKTNFPWAESSVVRYPEETNCDEFGDDLYAVTEVMPIQSINAVPDTPASDKGDEDSKIKALIDSSSLDWQMQPQDRFGAGRGFGRGMGGRMTGGRGFGRVGFERMTPPQGYVCHRCEMPGHFIQHCPTNGDPSFDKRRMKNPTGIPKDMLVVSQDGPYAMPGGAVAVLKPNEAAFDREFEGLSSNRSVGELPPELHCPLCKEVMKDAVLTSKCCFNSFCDKCIRNYIISKSSCVCGASNVLADDLLPNRTVRDTINRILESNNSSTENAGSVLQIQDTVSARCNQSKVQSPTVSATSKSGQMPSSLKKDPPDVNEAANGGQHIVNPPQLSLEKGRVAKAAELSEVTLESMHEKEAKLQGSASHAEEEVQQKLPTGEPGKKKKKKKTPFPINATELQWRPTQDFPAQNCMMPNMSFAHPTFDPYYSIYDPYWGGVQFGMVDGYMAPPYTGAMPYMNYGPPQGYMMPPVPPQRDISGFHMGFNPAPSITNREEFEARKSGLRRKLENDRQGQSREGFKDSESGRELNNNVDVSSMKSKSRVISTERNHNHQVEGIHGHERRPREPDLIRHGKNRSDRHDDKELAEDNYKHKASVFSRISVPEGGENSKKFPSTNMNRSNNNLSNGYKDSIATASAHNKLYSNGHHDDRKATRRGGETGDSGGGGRKSVMVMEQDSSGDEEERHFKRKRTRYESESMERAENARDVRSSRESESEAENMTEMVSTGTTDSLYVLSSC